ncbi:MAG TPA: AAA family ATPase [Gaiellaceae bacterium]
MNTDDYGERVAAAGRRPGRRPTKAEIEHEQAVSERLKRLKIEDEARTRLAAELALTNGGFRFPSAGRTLLDDLATPPRERKYVVESLHPVGGNIVFVSQYKAGKTTMLMNLMKSLADREPFLRKFEVAPLDGRIGFWNYELHDDMFRDWVRDMDVQHPERIAEPLHLRGTYLPIWLPEYAERAAEWLRKNEIEFLIADPIARAWAPLVQHENDNAQVRVFTDALDALKLAAGVPNLVVSAHTGRQQFNENEEHSRGATRLEDWMDAGWYLTRDGQQRRALRAMGRDVDVEALDLMYDGHARHIYTSGQTRSERRADEGLRNVVYALIDIHKVKPDTPHDRCPGTNDLIESMEGNKGDKTRAIKQAEERGLIERLYENGEKHDPRAAKTNRKLLCRPTAQGVRLHETGLYDDGATTTATARGRRVGRRRGRT